jgi:putative transposase
VNIIQASRIVSVAVIVAVGVNADGRREVLGMHIGPSQAETPHPEPVEGLDSLPAQARPTGPARGEAGYLRRPRRYQGRRLPDLHRHLVALPRSLHAQRLAHAGKSGRRVVSAFMATAFARDDAEQAKAQWRRVADQLRSKVPRLVELMDQAPPQHRTKLHSTNPLER